MIHADENVLPPLRSQERPLSFLKGHGGDGVLPGMLWASFLICCFICPQLDDTCRWKMSWLHSGVRNVLLASLKDMEETEYFLPSYELYYLNAASFIPNEKEKCHDSTKRTFLTPELSQDIYLFHLSSTLWQMKQHKKNEAHNLAGSTPSPPCPLRKLRGRSWLLSGFRTFFFFMYHLVWDKWSSI